MESSLRNTEAEYTATLTPPEEDWKREAWGEYISPLFPLLFSSFPRWGVAWLCGREPLGRIWPE